MKIKKTLNHKLLVYIGVSSTVFIILYSVIIAHYFMFAIELNSKFILENEAKRYATAYKTDVHTATPNSSFLNSYRTINNIPKPLLQLFSDDNFIHREMKSVFKEDFAYEKEAFETNNICHNEVCDIIFLYSYNLQENEWLYVVMGIPDTENDELQEAEFNKPLTILFSIALLFFVTIMALTLLLLKNIGQPIALLARWAENLDLVNLNEETPNLKFKELDVIAEHLKSAFIRINRMLENEKEFLNSASHELRTPIAVLSTNLSLLEAMKDNIDKESRESKVINRLFRAVENMKQLTQTLLWLSKNTDDFPKSTLVFLDKIIPQIIDENRYLIENKHVDIILKKLFSKVVVPEVLCKIVLTNLIRNALQHTYEGSVIITIEEGQVEVTNTCIHSADSLYEGENYGFGLGLELVRRISDKFNWQFNSKNIEGGRVTTLKFSTKI